MIFSNDDWKKSFKHSDFFALNVITPLSIDLEDHQKRLIFSSEIETFHPTRKLEFKLGRLCASVAHKLKTGSELLLLEKSEDRNPIWPSGIVGSITHNHHWVAAVVSKTEELIGVGIDFEVRGRTKLSLSGHIRSSGDIKVHSKFSEEELLTFIFSAKESLYKALYPSVQKYFGFQSAALREIDFDHGKFKIDLIADIGNGFSPNAKFHFEGRFIQDDQNILTAIEVIRD